jgi:hypothetical protein
VKEKATSRPAANPLSMPKRGPNVLVTGTPGTGKTSLCELVVQRFPLYKHVNVGEVVKAKGLHTGVDATFGAYMIDESNEDKIVDELESVMAEGCVLLEHHSVDFFPERWFDLVLVLRTDNTVLFDRLTKRWVGLLLDACGIRTCTVTPGAYFSHAYETWGLGYYSRPSTCSRLSSSPFFSFLSPLCSRPIPRPQRLH